MAATSTPDVERLLQPTFEVRHVKAALKHFQAMTAAFQQAAWEQAIAKNGQFVEAILKALYLHVGQTLPPARKFKAGTVMDFLEHQTPAASFDDTIRITIPRACRFAYDIASNRGARHDPAEIDPNLMDARVVVATAAWVLAESVRYAQKGALDPTTVRELVDGLTQRQYPFIEDVDGRVYFHVIGASAPDVAVLSLWRKSPGRLTKAELMAAVTRHRFSKASAAMAVSRIARLVDEDDQGRLRLLQPGFKRAEQLIGAELKK
jgi:hypothetical protein